MPDNTGLLTASDKVSLQGVDPHLIAFAQHLAMAHQVLFSTEMVITSGKDSIHATGSLHSIGRALDVRIKDLDPESQALFLHVLAFSAVPNSIAFFDERALGDEAHVHIEYHGK
jgi:hypothetical protein